jgi:signal transduction histidine kinase
MESVYLSISDNEKGFDKELFKNKNGVGLYNIANQAELFNGKINYGHIAGKWSPVKWADPGINHAYGKD